ncbi:hypothetical protein KCP70_13715 [Salmonella enterica subsp. enterica]|nr:hypothetical protein KCP70_13715 [Salmonella enterica subsp. enterica]
MLAMVLGILLGSYLHYHSDSRRLDCQPRRRPLAISLSTWIKMIVVPT